MQTCMRPDQDGNADGGTERNGWATGLCCFCGDDIERMTTWQEHPAPLGPSSFRSSERAVQRLAASAVRAVGKFGRWGVGEEVTFGSHADLGLNCALPLGAGGGTLGCNACRSIAPQVTSKLEDGAIAFNA